MKEVTIISVWNIVWIIFVIGVLLYIYKYPPKLKLQVDLGGLQ